MNIKGLVGPRKISLGDGGPPKQGAEGQFITGDLHGRHYQAVKEGRVFMQTTTPLGLAIPIYTGTAPRVALLNPKGSGKNAVLIRIGINRASGTTVEFSAGLMRVLNVGAVGATGTPVTVFAADEPYNALVGGGERSKMLSTSSGTVTTTAGVAADFFYSIFHSYAAVGATAVEGGVFEHDFDGAVLVAPGTMIYLAATVASVALYATSLIWEEVDE